MKTTKEIAQEAVNEMDKGMICNSLNEWNEHSVNIITKAIEAAQVQGEPVAWRVSFSGGMTWTLFYEYPAQIVIEASHQQILIDPLYTAPPKRQPLTPEKARELWVKHRGIMDDSEISYMAFMGTFRHFEAAINGGGA